MLFVACGDDSSSTPTKDAAADTKKAPKKEAGADTTPGTDGTQKPDGTIKPDSTKPDSTIIPSTCTAASVGKPCKDDSECGTGDNKCVDFGSGQGICTCPCTPDDPDTEVANEDSCPSNSKINCIAMPETTPVQAFCFQLCSPELGKNGCTAPFACDPYITYALETYDKVVCAISGCTKDADCQVIGKDCTVANTGECATDQKCLPLSSSAPQGPGKCVGPGKCDVPSGICAPHDHGKASAKVGDPCTSDYDCAGNMNCFGEFDSSEPGKPGPIYFRNGYCTISNCLWESTLTSGKCPADTACNFFFVYGACEKECDMTKAETCRGVAADRLGDYECRGYNAVFSNILKPLCDPGPFLPCDSFATWSTPLYCEYFSADSTGATNPTNMGCRGLDNVVKTNNVDPAGYCLDDTPASTVLRGQNPPDAGVTPDTGSGTGG